MVWKISYSETAEKQLSKLDKAVQRTVDKYLSECCSLEDPAARGDALTGPFAGYHRYRIGQLRLIVQFERGILTIAVAVIDKRDTIYK
jgi:mRNA interferase RelE/StbE